MTTCLVRHARLLVTMDGARREIADGGVLIRDGVIEQVGKARELPQTADRIIEAHDHIVMPGLVNTHHHLFQALTRATPGAQNANLFDWLRHHYPVWARLTPEMAFTSAQLALAELMLSGCTTAADHHYLYPPGVRLDDEIAAARELGMRFYALRGSMSVGESQGGLPPDEIVEDEEHILRDSRRVIETYHDASPYSMCRVAVAPCAPFNVSERLMRASAELARSYGVRLHTHVAETREEEAYCLAKVGLRPTAYMERLGWVGKDVWWAHAVQLNAEEIALLAQTGTGVAHCPSSNARLGSGIAPIREYLDAGVPVGLAVDGSASNDSGHLLLEARMALLLQRAAKGASALSAREALEMATLGGAAVLGWDHIGALAPGKAADMIGFRLDDIALAGAHSDPVAALILCAPLRVDFSLINGREVIRNGQLLTVDLPALIARHNALSQQLLG